MSLRILIFICFLTILKFSSVASVTIECNYTMDYDEFYPCKVQNIDIFNGDRLFIEKAVGKHDKRKTDDDVEALWIDDANTKFFPRNINNVFKNLVLISIRNSSLIEITSDDLKVFPQLKTLILFKNQIEVIREDTFKFNPNLEHIYLNYNKISHIEPKSFSGLENLNFLLLNGNVCKFGYAEDREEVLEVITELVERKFCQSQKFQTNLGDEI
ncbi:hypothetical protein PVAND_008711 [Polypedilum vanderplanki]|uniref:Uncharacterized protein n=1 Tax=Polypedilum vanderplanki TaxID=319348 RepID=A0A9J6CAU0_POLVA|nr:hypothetical protein PVAND_008711 [Polypedilum vanderplanki]